MSAGSELLSPHMVLKDKCVDSDKRRMNPDIRPMTISHGGQQTICPITVQGNVFQLKNRLLVRS